MLDSNEFDKILVKFKYFLEKSSIDINPFLQQNNHITQQDCKLSSSHQKS